MDAVVSSAGVGCIIHRIDSNTVIGEHIGAWVLVRCRLCVGKDAVGADLGLAVLPGLTHTVIAGGQLFRIGHHRLGSILGVLLGIGSKQSLDLGTEGVHLMNDAIYKFKRYEDNSLRYTGIDRHFGQDVGGWDTIMERENYDHLFALPHSYAEPAPTVAVIEQETEKAEPVPAPKQSKTSVSVIPNVSTTAPVQRVVKTTPLVSVQANKTESDIEVSVGSVVVHKVFGEGTVTQLDKVLKHIRVAFAKDEKTFIFPDAFNQGFWRTKG